MFGALVDRGRDYLWFLINTARAAYSRRQLRKLLEDETASGGATIVVIPGIYEDAGYFHSVMGPLRERGYSVKTIAALGRMRGPVPDLAKVVLENIAGISGPVILLAHSKGALVGRAVLAALPRNVHGLIAFAAPWEGSKLAWLFPPWTVVGRLIPGGSDVRYGWSENREELIRPRICSIRPSWDPHIPGGSNLRGAHNITLTTPGHFRSLADPESLGAIFACADKLVALPPLHEIRG